MAKQVGVIVFLCSIVMVPATAVAQQSGSTVAPVATVLDRGVNGVDRVTEKVVTHLSHTADGEEVVIETYRPLVYERRLDLAQRVRRVTTVTIDGSETVEDTEEVPRGAPHERMRIVRRSVTTVRKSGTDRYVTERRFFEVDLNGRFVPVKTTIEHRSGT